MCPSDDHMILGKKFHQLPKRKEAASFFIRLQTTVQFQDFSHASDRQDMAALRNIRLHPRKNTQPVRKYQGVSLLLARLLQIPVDFLKLKGIEMFCQA